MMKHLKVFGRFGQCIYMELILKIIQLQKDIFLLELGLGNESHIPLQL